MTGFTNDSPIQQEKRTVALRACKWEMLFEGRSQ